MNKCHLAKLYLATLLATAPVVFAQAPAQIAGRLNGLFFLPHIGWKKKMLTRDFFEKLKEVVKVEKDCFEAIIESTRRYDFTYADKKVWWPIHYC